MTIRPTKRGGCSVKGACPYVSCRHHLAVDTKQSTILSSYGDSIPGVASQVSFEAWSSKLVRSLVTVEHTCSLDVADSGPKTLDEVGELLGVCKERVRQIEEVALRKLSRLKVLRDRHSDGEGLNRGQNPDKIAMILVSNVR